MKSAARALKPALRPWNERVAQRDLKYYIFDWDDNILKMPTRIHLERRGPDGRWRPCAVSTSTFALLRNDVRNVRPPGGGWESAFHEFRDRGRRSAFLDHTRRAIRDVQRRRRGAPPSFDIFRRILVEGRLFAIVTARGHHPRSLRRGVELFIREVLTPAERREMIRNLRGYMHSYEGPAHHLRDAGVLKYYLGLNRYHPVTWPQAAGRGRDKAAAPLDTGRAKQLAVRDFVGHVLALLRRAGVERQVSIGFSDDDRGNVRAVEEYIRRELVREFPGVKFVVYDTSESRLPHGRKVIVHGQLDLPLPDRGAAARRAQDE
jgi:hypothetical protein